VYLVTVATAVRAAPAGVMWMRHVTGIQHWGAILGSVDKSELHRRFDICLQPNVKVPPSPEDLLVYFFLSGYEQKGLEWD
jgi:hypothetical protein